MPWQTLNDVPDNLKSIEPPLTLAQANLIAEWAEAMEASDDPPDNAWAVAIAQFRDQYTPRDGQWVAKDAPKAATELLAFESVLLATSATGAGLIWKEVLHPGKWYKTDSGKQIAVTPEIIKEAYRAFNDGLPKLVSVPVDHHYLEQGGIVPPNRNAGFVRALKLGADGALYAGFDFTNGVIAAGVQDGSIADCSVYLRPQVIHPKTGEKYGWVLRHVLLTNNPLVQDLKGWNEDIPATDSEGSLTISLYQRVPVGDAVKDDYEPKHKEQDMSEEDAVVLGEADEITLTGAAAQEYASIASLGLTAAQLHALALARDEIAAQAIALQKQERQLEVDAVIAAMEGHGEHNAVTQLPGYRHYPVVIEAVRAALEKSTALALAATDEIAAPDVDAVVLSVANAIPQEGRIALSEPPGVNKDRPAKRDTGGNEEVSDEQVDRLVATIGL